MNKTRIPISQEFLRDLIGMPPDWRVLSVSFEDSHDVVVFVVDTGGLELGRELRAKYTKDENGEISVEWTPMNSQGPLGVTPSLTINQLYWCNGPKADPSQAGEDGKV